MSGNREQDEPEQAPADEQEVASNNDREQEFERAGTPRPSTTTNPRIKST